MRRLHALCLAGALVALGTVKADGPELKTDDEKTIYALGFVEGDRLNIFKMTPAEFEILKAGLTDAILKKPAKIEIETFGPKIKPLADARIASGVGDEKKKGKAYLETIAAKPNIKKTGSGMLMETIAEGTGKTPVPTDTVKVNYKGTLIDGTVFDSSEKHGGPQSFSLKQVYKCWQEGLEFMKAGGKAKLYCPPELANGDQPRGLIPPGATLTFEVELLEIIK